MPPDHDRESRPFFILPEAGRIEVDLVQGWRDEPEPDFRPARVELRANRACLEVEACLQDDDIFNPVTGFNQPAFLHGDVVEIFLRPDRQAAYLELHIGPDGQLFQLRIPSAEIFAAARGTPEPWRAWLLEQPCCEAHTLRLIGPSRWQAQARIPTAAIAEQPVRRGDRWWFSFSRYDYTRGRAQPVLSSSSRHRAVSFHRQQEWRSFVMP